MDLSQTAYTLAGYTPVFYLSLATLVLGIVGSVYLFIEWLYHRRQYRFVLFWSLSLFVHYLFQVPAILANAGVSFTLTDFSVFFAITYPLVFLAYIFIYLGLRSLFPPLSTRRGNIFFSLWFAAFVAIFVAHKLVGVPVNNVSATIILLLFILPIQFLILRSLVRWFRSGQCLNSLISKIGIVVIIAAVLAKMGQALFVFNNILKYPPDFWFVAISSSQTLFISQSLSTLLLLIGFFFVHQSCCRATERRHL